MTKIQSFTDLMTWQKGHKLVLMIYSQTKSFPPEEKFSLTSRIRRSAVSVTSNIAEGFGRQGKNDKLHFYTMSRGSVLELQNQLIIAKDIKLLAEKEFTNLLDQATLTHKLANGLIRSIKNAA